MGLAFIFLWTTFRLPKWLEREPSSGSSPPGRLLHGIMFCACQPSKITRFPLLSKHGFKMVFESEKDLLTKNGVFVEKGYSGKGLVKPNVD
jgi:hypothetical protein